MYLNRCHFYEFGAFRLDAVERVLLRDGHPVPLTPKAYETLLALVENSGHVTDKDELLKRIWPDTFVEEATLAKNVFMLRRVLGDTAEGHDYIQTVPKRGYRFVAAVKELDDTSLPELALPARATTSAPHADRSPFRTAALGLALALLVAGYFAVQHFSSRAKLRMKKIMVVVLPFQNLRGDPEQKYFSDGLTEEVITQLGGLEPSRLGVIARTSAMQYTNTQGDTRQIGRDLGVDYILEGSVRHEGNRVRISAQLIQVKDQSHLWAANYDRDLRGILTLQSDVASAIARQIELKLTPEQHARLASAGPVSPDAYELYLKGRYFWNKRSEDGYTNAIVYFKQAIALDPSYARTYAGLADAYALLGSIPNVELGRSEAMARARQAASKALELDETLAEAHASLAFVHMHFDWDWPRAEKEFKRAIELNPGYATAHHWYAYYLMAQHRTEEALREIRLAQQSDPLSIIINTDVGEMLYYARRYDEAIEQARKTLEMDSNFALAHHLLGLTYLEKHQHAESIEEFKTAIRLPGRRADLLSSLGVAYAKDGQRDEALQVLDRLKQTFRQRRDMALVIARLLAAIGDRDQSCAWLEKSYQGREGGLILLNVVPEGDPLRSDPCLNNLVRRIGLPP